MNKSQRRDPEPLVLLFKHCKHTSSQGGFIWEGSMEKGGFNGGDGGGL